MLAHSQIHGATVLGVPDSAGTGELPRAYIVRKPQIALEPGDNAADGEASVISEEGVKAFVAARLARYKHLDGGVCFVDQIPRNAMGKAVKPQLLAMDRSGEGHT